MAISGLPVGSSVPCPPGTFEGLRPQLMEKQRVPQTNRDMGTDERDIRTKDRRPSEAAARAPDSDSAPGLVRLPAW